MRQCASPCPTYVSPRTSSHHRRRFPAASSPQPRHLSFATEPSFHIMRRLLPPPPRHTPPPLHTWPDPLAQTYRPSSCYTAEPPSNDPFPPDDPVPPDVLAAFEHFGASGSLTYHALAHALRYFGVETTMAGAIALLHQYDHPNGKHLDLAAFAKLIHDQTVGWEYAQQTQPQPQPQETQPQTRLGLLVILVFNAGASGGRKNCQFSSPRTPIPSPVCPV